MALSINTSAAALNAQRSARQTQSALATAMARLSSGLRINSARDDAAGLAIAGRFTSQIRGLEQAGRNVNDGISLAQTAEGGLSRASELMQPMRELAVQSANGSNSARDRASLQQEVAQLQKEFSRVVATTQFNGSTLLDGRFGGALFQVGANAGEAVGVNVGNARAEDIGNHRVVGDTGYGSAAAVYVVYPTGFYQQNAILAHSITVGSAAGSVDVDIADGASAKSVAASVNAASDRTGVTATARTVAYFGGFGASSVAGGPISFQLAGANGNASPVTISAKVTASDTSDLVAAVNARTTTTGIRAEAYAGSALSFGIGIKLSNDDGSDIYIADFVNASTPPGGGLVEMNSGGSNYVLPQGYDATVGGSIDLASPSAFAVQTVGGSGYGYFFCPSGNPGTAASSLSSLGAIDIGTAAGAVDALSVLDSALQSVASSRAAMGAAQSRFASMADNLASTSENLSAARGRIQDADFAIETAAWTRGQVLQSAASAMLAQANALPNVVLALLRG